MRRLAQKGARREKTLCCVDSRVVLGAGSKERSSSRKVNFRLRLLACCCLSASLTLDLLWLLTWANPAGAHSRAYLLGKWRKALPKWPAESPVVQFLSDAVTSETQFLQEPLPQKAIDDLRHCCCKRDDQSTCASQSRDSWR